jgi:predicted alpha/beta hydrolase family esterase
MKPSNILTLPGWHGSGPRHWQTLWEQRHGYVRADQHDWATPRRGDWLARLEDLLLSRSSH